MFNISVVTLTIYLNFLRYIAQTTVVKNVFIQPTNNKHNCL